MKNEEKGEENNSKKERDRIPNRKSRIFLIVIQIENGFSNSTKLTIIPRITKENPISIKRNRIVEVQLSLQHSIFCFLINFNFIIFNSVAFNIINIIILIFVLFLQPCVLESFYIVVCTDWNEIKHYYHIVLM